MEHDRVVFLKSTLQKIVETGEVTGSREAVLAGEALSLLDGGSSLPWPSETDIEKLERAWDLRELKCAVCGKTEFSEATSLRTRFAEPELCMECNKSR